MPARFRALAGILLAGMWLASPARAADAEGKPLLGIEFRGNDLLSTPYLAARVRLVAGAPLRAIDVETAVRDLYAVGVSQVRSEIVEESEGVRLILHVTENVRLAAVRQVGCPRKIWKDVMEESGLASGQLVFRTDLAEVKRKLLEALRERRYYRASVAEDIAPTDRGIVVTMRVDPGPRGRVVSVRYEGNAGIKDGRIKKRAPVKTRPRFLFFFGGVYDPREWEADLERIRQFYVGEGWLDAAVSGKTDISPDGKAIRLTAIITEGDRYVVDDLRIEQRGASFPEERLLERVKTRVGEPYVPRLMESDLDRIRDVVWNEGYFRATVHKEPTFDFKNKRVSLRIVVESGETVTLRALSFRGNIYTRDRVLRREFDDVIPGEPLRWGKIQDGVRRLRYLNFFEPRGVAARPQDTEDPHAKDVVVDVEEGKTGSFSVGGGVTSDDAVFASILYRQRNYDIARWAEFPFSRGGGQDLLIKLEPGTVRSQYELSFFEPWLFDRPVGFGFNVYLRQRIYDLYTEERRGGSVTVSRRLTRAFKTGLTFKTERINVDDVEPEAPSTIHDVAGTTRLNSFIPFFVWDVRDNPYVPTEGMRVEGSYEIAGGRLGGADFTKALLEWSGHAPVYEDRQERRHVFSARLAGGWTEEYGQTAEVPIFERFFAGGATTIRGFDFRSVSPREGDEEVGGNFRLLSNVEYSFPLLAEEEILRGALFVDRGVVAGRISEHWLNAFRSAWGVGLRISIPGLTPVPLQLDFAWPMETRDGDTFQVFSFMFSGLF